jgi:pilus assembly protein Flp/PilA
MFKVASFIKKFARDEKGVTYIEYGLIAALIAVVVVGLTGDIGNQLVDKFTTILTELGGTPS